MKTKITFTIGAMCLLIGCITGPIPEPTVDADLSNGGDYPEGFFPGQWAEIQVTAFGETEFGPNVKPRVDVVFLIDESGSMTTTDPDQIRRSTVVNELSSMTTDQHRAAVVVFGNDADSLNGLTSSFGNLSDSVDDLPDPDGYTNIADAMEEANSLLADSSANTRIAILLTDGYPASEDSGGYYDTAQDAEINTQLVPEAIQKDIQYYVVHLVPADMPAMGTALLKNRIAEDTGGEYFPGNAASDFATVVPDIVDSASRRLVLKDVQLELVVDMSPNRYSEVDENELYVTGPFPAGPAFEHTGNSVRTAVAPELGDNQAIIVIMPVTTQEPVPLGSPPEVLDVDLPVFLPSARLSYHLGDGDVQTVTVPQVNVLWRRPPSVLVYKDLHPGDRRVTISITNFMPDQSMYDVVLLDVLGKQVEPLYSTIEPEPIYVAPDDPLTYVYWDVGTLHPYETKRYSFDFNYSGPAEGSVALDMRKPESVVSYMLQGGEAVQISTGKRADLGGWFGDIVVDASVFNLDSSAGIGPDLALRQLHNNLALNAGQPPWPRNFSFWHDSAIDGFDEETTLSYFAEVEPVSMAHDSALWIRVDNRGTSQANGYLIADVYATIEYDGSVDDWDTANWTEVGSHDFGNIHLSPEQIIVERFEWSYSNLPMSLTGASPSALFLMVDLRFNQSELRQNNNTGIVNVDVVP